MARSDRLSSPCTGVCTMDRDKALCQGCFRSLDEIAAWSSMSAEQRRAVLKDLPRRRR